MEKMKQSLEAAQERKVNDGLAAGSSNDNSMYLTAKEKKRFAKKKVSFFQKKTYYNQLQFVDTLKKKNQIFIVKRGFLKKIQSDFFFL
ncbi:hypothetical protein RFI_38921 [Reticulomyxa filosa]|uniref:Uncharacterized protein n=1 Tax=Reticulomyxa filosa TaxID=46433 RepID=X6LB22_RETFI|nr:hypothetical protein RFI_38921 [Reticulomyxa filosa]|eukprot:ETN98570.1 hypothetical protein RFI_38921 [Reticulomyxa filosa]